MFLLLSTATLATYSEIRLKWHNCKAQTPHPYSIQSPPTTLPLKSLIHCLAARNQNSLATLKSSQLLHFRTAAAHSTEVVNKVLYPPASHFQTPLKKKLPLIDLTLQQKFAEQVSKLVELGGNGMGMAQRQYKCYGCQACNGKKEIEREGGRWR